MARDPIDMHVGARLRMRRNLLGMSQETLARRLDITFQQVQKYEKGTNRISASKLHAMADAFGISVAYFFEEMPAGESGRTDAAPRSVLPTLDSEAMRLVRYYLKIKNPTIRQHILAMIDALGNAGDISLIEDGPS